MNRFSDSCCWLFMASKVKAGEKVRKFRRERVERRVTRHRLAGAAISVLLDAVTHTAITFVFRDNID